MLTVHPRYHANDSGRGAGACHALLRKKKRETAVTSAAHTQAGGELTLAERRQTASNGEWKRRTLAGA